MKVLVFGTRDNVESLNRLLWARLDRLLETRGSIFVIEGECPTPMNIDKQAREWAKARGQQWKGYPAEEHGAWPACGPKRNRHMLRAHPDVKLGLCFHHDVGLGKGSRDMATVLCDAGIPVEIHLRRKS